MTLQSTWPWSVISCLRMVLLHLFQTRKKTSHWSLGRAARTGEAPQGPFLHSYMYIICITCIWYILILTSDLLQQSHHCSGSLILHQEPDPIGQSHCWQLWWVPIMAHPAHFWLHSCPCLSPCLPHRSSDSHGCRTGGRRSNTVWGLWTELTHIICPLLLFCYSRGDNLLFLVKKKKKNTTESSLGHKAAYPGDYSFHLVIPVVKSLSIGCLH